MRATAAILLAVGIGSAHADPTSGVDVALSRSSYDSNGIFSLEGARLLPRHDLSFKVMLGYAKSPFDVSVPGIGAMAGDTGKDSVLDYLVTLDMAFGLTIADHVAIGLDVATYRTSTAVGYGARGRYANGVVTAPSTGLISLRPLSNIDPSANPSDPSSYLGDGLAGPLDARAGIKVGLYADQHLALTAVGSVFLPFGEDQMLLGDRNLVYEPKLATEWRFDRIHQTRILVNLAARFRERAVLEAYDTADSTATAANAKAFFDVGSELVAGLGGTLEITPRAIVALEAQAFIPLPDTLSYGTCTRYNGMSCKSLTDADYWPGAKHGDRTVLATIGMMLRVSADVTADLMIGAGALGARGDDLRITTGLVWAPQLAGVAAPGRNDHDGDGVPDSIDGCPDDPEDKDGFQDEDGCPDPDNDGDGIPDGEDGCPNEPEDKDGFQDSDGCPESDNDNDGIPDSVDKCPNEPEDKDGFEDDDGCPDQDNDGDGIPDATDKCPNDPETVNGFEDDDGCPDVRATTGPEERADRIDLKGQAITFGKDGKLTPGAKQLLTQVANLIKSRKLTIRVEVHVPLGTKATNAAVVAAQKKKDKATAQRRGAAIFDYLVAQGVPQPQIQAVGIGSDRPLGTANPSDPLNDRIDFIKAQQGGAP
ncbi:MAG: putative internalin [Myxococcales bacterium]|nr:putative internalin [Myxococcales bacterium]